MKAVLFGARLSGEGVVLPGFEPGQAEPKTAVLPLHHKTIRCAQAVLRVAAA